MRQHVVYILDLSMTLTYDLYAGGGGILSEFYSQFLSFLFVSNLNKTFETLPIGLDVAMAPETEHSAEL